MSPLTKLLAANALELNASSNPRDYGRIRINKVRIDNLEVKRKSEGFSHGNFVIELDTLSVAEQVGDDGPKFVTDSNVVPAHPEGVVFTTAKWTVTTDAEA